MSSADTALLVGMTGIRKSFGPVTACDKAFVTVGAGGITAVVGANGAGKSTLVNILCGVVSADAGDILVDGQIRTVRGPRDAAALGIGLVAQRPFLVGELTGIENCALALGALPTRKLREHLEAIAERIGFRVALAEKVQRFSPAQRQQLDILRLLARNVRVMVLDEPTSVLSPVETRALLDALKRLAGEGKAILYVSHKLDEVLEIADTIFVMSAGKTVAKLSRAEATPEKLVRLIAGADLPGPVRRVRAESPRKGGLEVDGLCTWPAEGTVALDELSFNVRRGEVFGVAGVAGNGQRELAEALAGLVRPRWGEMRFDDRPVRSTGERFDWVAYVPEDTDADGLVGSMALCENLLLGAHRQDAFFTRRSLAARARGIASEFEIVADPWTPVGTLSGGNRMKALLAREFNRAAPLLVICSPAAGLDVKAAAMLGAHIRRSRDKGAAVVLISYDLDELFELADRIGVLWRGRFVAEWPKGMTSREEVLRVMISGARAE